MKNIKEILIVLAFVLACAAQGTDQVITITEIANARETADGKKNLQAVDINSTLKITIDRKNVHARCVDQVRSKDSVLVQTFDKLNRILRYQIQLLAAMNDSLGKHYRTPDTSAYNTVSWYLRDLFKALKSDSVLKKETIGTLNEYLFTADSLTKARYTRERYVVEHFIGKMENSSSLIDSLIIKTNRFQFLMTAYTLNKNGGSRVHIENFDTMANGNFYEVSKWVYSLSDNEKKKLSDYKLLADSLNVNYQAVLRTVGNNFVSSFQTIRCAEELSQICQDALGEFTTVVEGDMKKLRDTVHAFGVVVNSVAATARNLSAAMQVEDFVTALKYAVLLSTQLKGMLTDFENFAAYIKQMKMLYSLKTQAMVDTLYVHIAQCKVSFQQDVVMVTQLSSHIGDYINPSRRIYSANESISASVQRFGITQIPEAGYIDLRYTGKRDEFDKIRIRAILCVNDVNGIAQPELKEIDRRILTLMKLGFHSEANVGILFMHPDKSYNPQNVKLQNRFQFTASTNILVKYGFRSAAYNNFLDFGIGVDMAYPDFNLDGTPEYCMGLIVTGLRNTISGGINWNFGVDVPCYFFGISLPFNILEFPFIKNEIAHE